MWTKCATQINKAKREEKWQDRKMDSTEKLLQQLLYRGIQKLNLENMV